MNSLQKKILGIAFGIIVLALAAATLALPKKEYSENENRYLADFPKFSLETIADSSFMKELEDYLSDHFALRDLFMTLKSGYEQATGRNQVNGVYICKDGYYIKQYKEAKNTERIVAAIRRLANNVETADIHIMLVPTAVTVYADKLPSASINADQLAEMQRIVEANRESVAEINASGSRSVDYIDVTDTLMAAAESEQLYYRLDHHWTTAGAYLAYVEFCKSLGFTALGRDKFTEKTVSESFYGSFYSDVNDLTTAPDSIKAFYSDRLKLSVEYPDKKQTRDSLYAEEYLEKKDKYSFFLNNQNSFVEISNEAAESDRAIVLVKDSYANCFVPFLAEHYSKIYVFDTRYYRDSVSEFVNTHADVTDVLFLYNMYTIDTDTGIGGIK